LTERLELAQYFLAIESIHSLTPWWRKPAYRKATV
jgi:hypothetical protein